MNSSLLFSSIDNNPPSYNSTTITMPIRSSHNQIITYRDPEPNLNFLDKYVCTKNGCALISITCLIITIIVIITMS
jgi:hypothetical protein